jgi:hypothetical protein
VALEPEAGVQIRVRMIIGDEVGVLGLGEPGIGIREKERGLTS